MILNLGSLAFNANIESGGGTPAWGTELGQGEGYKFVFEDMSDFFTGMVYKSVSDTDKVTCPLGKGGNQRADYDFVIASVFDKVYVNERRVNEGHFLLLVVKKLNGDHHVGRRTIKYNPRMTYRGEYINEDCYRKMANTMGLPENAAWFVYEIFIKNQDELHFTAFELGREPQSYRSNDERKNAFISRLPKGDKNKFSHFVDMSISTVFRPYLTAIQTKPFLLLAGISGTGKSRIVRELAFKSCPKYLQDKDGTTPGNYCMIEVKPNWHDSTELLGYYSRLGQAGYQFKKFVMFMVKAKMFPKVPFFVCLDEMNLAPVEHYFAEILSILETRKHPKIDGTDEMDMDVIKTDPIVEARYFKELGKVSNTRNSETGQAYSTILTDRDIYMKLYGIDTENVIDPEVGKRTDLTTIGLTLPDNVIIIGTVNMDDTTHQFSRKVIDRAMTIEMNGGKLSDMYGGSKDLEYLDEAEQQKWQKAFKQKYVTADEVLAEHSEVADKIIEKVPGRLEEINKALKGTPFEVSYRVLNELTIMVGVMLDEKTEGESLDTIIDKAIDRILLMKILPRIEGDRDMFELSSDFQKKNDIAHDNRLEWLKEVAPKIEADANEPHQQTAREKIQEMIDRLENQDFTRFWP